MSHINRTASVLQCCIPLWLHQTFKYDLRAASVKGRSPILSLVRRRSKSCFVAECRMCPVFEVQKLAAVQANVHEDNLYRTCDAILNCGSVLRMAQYSKTVNLLGCNFVFCVCPLCRCVENMLRQAQLESKGTRQKVLSYIGMVFRHSLQAPDWYLDAAVANFLIKYVSTQRCTCSHAMYFVV